MEQAILDENRVRLLGLSEWDLVIITRFIMDRYEAEGGLLLGEPMPNYIDPDKLELLLHKVVRCLTSTVPTGDEELI